MMSTLFIGPPDWVFRWEEHQSLFVGILVGMTLASLVTTLLLGRRKNNTKTAVEQAYQPVTMNEIKSKAMD